MAPSQRRRPRSASATASDRNTRQRLSLSAEAMPPSVEYSSLNSRAASCGDAAPTVPRTSATDMKLAAAVAAAATTAVGDGVLLAASQPAAQPRCPPPTSQQDHAGPALGTRSRALRHVHSGGSQTQAVNPALQLTAHGQNNVATGSHVQGEASSGASALQQGNSGAGATTFVRPATRPGLQLAPPSEQPRRPDTAPHLSNCAAAQPGNRTPSDTADATAPLPASHQPPHLQESPAPPGPQLPLETFCAQQASRLCTLHRIYFV
jgi:hypothetical protein